MKRLCKNKKWNIQKEYDINKILYLLIDRPDECDLFLNVYCWFDKENKLYRNYNLPDFIDKLGLHI